MFRRGLVTAAAALSLLSASGAAIAAPSASALSVARAGASVDRASDLEAGSGALIGIGIFVAIVAAVFLVADSDDQPTSA